MTPQDLAHELEKIYGENLLSVVLYGSAATEEYSEKFSDYNVFCVLTSPSTTELARSNSLVKKWTKNGNPSPHFFGAEHIHNSLDVFPLEFLDIKDRHKILFGNDPLKNMSIDPKNLRHQCEAELKGKLIHLRSFYATNCHKPKVVARVAMESFSTILTALRGTLRLLGKKPPRDSRAAVEIIAQQIGLTLEIFHQMIAIRQGQMIMPMGEDALGMFERYLTAVELITNYVDRMRIDA